MLGTYGRGIFIGDITHLQELSAAVLDKPFHLFAVEPRTAYNFRAQGNFHLFGNAYIEVPNEPDALVINYSLRAKDDAGARVTIADIKGHETRPAQGPVRSRAQPRAMEHAGRGGAGAAGEAAGVAAGPTLPAGEYRITVEVGGSEGDDGRPDSRAAAVGPSPSAAD